MRKRETEKEPEVESDVDSETEQIEQIEAELAPASNVAFWPKDREPPDAIHGVVDFEGLPGAEAQRSGFFHKRAAELVRARPDLYKPIVRKGE